MKNKKFFLAILLGMMVIFSIRSVYAAEIVKNKISSGAVGVKHNAPGKKLKVLIQKGGKKYTYSLRNDGGTDYYPLQLGSGSYKVTVLQNVSGSRYSILKSESVSANISNPNSVYLNSIQIVDYANAAPAVKTAKSINSTNGVYDYVVKNVKYDYNKAATVQPGYYPNINDTFNSKKGICYDFSSMDAGMLRSIGVPTKLVKGYAKGVDGYHAWNEVFLNGKWQVVDTTYDSAMWGGKAKYTMVKNSGDYQKVYEY